MENPLNVPRFRLLSVLGYLSIATLGALVIQPIFAAEVGTSDRSNVAAIPEMGVKSDTLLIARKPKAQKRRKVRVTKSTRRISKRRKASTVQTIQPNSSVPPAPEDNSSAQLTPTVPAAPTTEPIPTPLDQAPIPTTVQPAKPSARDNYSVNVESYYSAWSDNFGNNGNQLVTPLTVTYAKDDFNIGIRTAYINSNFNGVLLLDGQKIGTRQGSVSTLSDTSLSLAYNLKKSDYPVRFNLDFNLPTGRATLVGDEKNAIMDGSLVQQTRFGEGFNIAPGVSVSHALSPKDVVGVGTSYIIRGQFDPNGDVTKDEIKPGNDLVGTLQYQHLDSNWMAMGGLIYTNSGVTQRGGLDYYQKGARLDVNFTGAYVPFDRNRVQLTTRYFTQSPDNVRNFFTGNLEKETANNNGNALYVGLDWGLGLDKRQQHNIHFLADWLGVQANSYDRINDLFNAGRSKYSIGLGYEYINSPTNRWNIQAKYFNVIDNATPITQKDITSNGLSIFANVNFDF
jgi:hypothetical protein